MAGLVLAVILLRAVRVWFSIPLYRRFWLREARRPAPQNAISLVVLGDSVAQGIGATEIRFSYVGRLMRAITELTGRPAQIINLSVSGARMQDVLEHQLPELARLRLRPDIILLEAGANDTAAYRLPRFSQTVRVLLDGLPPHTIVATVPPFGGRRNRAARRLNKIIIREVAAHGMSLAPVHEQLLKNSSIRNTSGDFFHPGNRGHGIWFEAFWQVIKPRLQADAAARPSATIKGQKP